MSYIILTTTTTSSPTKIASATPTKTQPQIKQEIVNINLNNNDGTITLPTTTAQQIKQENIVAISKSSNQDDGTKTPATTPSRTKSSTSSSHSNLHHHHHPQQQAQQPGQPQQVTARLMDMGKRLLEATREGRTDLVRQLVVSSGAPFTSDWLGTTALHFAAQSGSAEIAEILLRGGVNRDARTKLERTALHLAAQSGGLDVVDLLLNHGSEVNAQDMLKMTPIHWAVERCHVRVVERLLLAGADVSIRNKFQLTPTDIAQNAQHYEILELFKSWNCKEENLDEAFRKLSEQFEVESRDMLDFDYHLALVGAGDNCDAASTSQSNSTLLDIVSPCADLDFEWNKLDLFLAAENGGCEEPKDDCLLKVIEKLEMENRQLRQQVEHLSTSPATSP